MIASHQSGTVLTAVKTASRPPFGGGLCYAPASLDRGCARRPRQFQVGTGKRRFDRTEKLALGAGLDRPSEFNWQT